MVWRWTVQASSRGIGRFALTQASAHYLAVSPTAEDDDPRLLRLGSDSTGWLR